MSFISLISSLTIYSFFTYAFLAYLIGFTLDLVAGELISNILTKIKGDLKNRILSDFKEKNPGYNLEEYHFSTIYSYVDLNSPTSREKIDQYTALSDFARNLSLIFLFFVLVSIYNLFFTQNNISLVTSVLYILFGFIFFWILMIRSDEFRKWGHTHLLNIYYLQKYDKKTD